MTLGTMRRVSWPRCLPLLAILAACGGDGGPDTIEPPPDTTDTETPSGFKACTDGMAGRFPCSGIDLVSQRSKFQLGNTQGFVNDVWGWVDPETGVEWALVGHGQGTAYVSLEDPERPVVAGVLPRTEGTERSLWTDVKVYKDHAFIVADRGGNHGMQVFDLSQLRDVSNPPETFSATHLYDRVHSAHNIAINEETGFAYSVGGRDGGETCGGGLHMIDIRAPTNPQFAGCFADESTGRDGTGYTHDAMCVVYRGPDTDHQDKEICFGFNETALSIADVSDKANPAALATASYPGVAYAHQGWLDEAQEYLYTNDELDEYNSDDDINTRTIVWDVKDLDDPVVVKHFLHPTESTDHNLYIVGDVLYMTNYSAGFRILDIADRAKPVEVAFFDTEPDHNFRGLQGAWSSYPFFESGVIPVSSMANGIIFVKRPN